MGSERSTVVNSSVVSCWVGRILRHATEHAGGLRRLDGGNCWRLVLNNREGQLFTMPEMERADRILKDVYGKAEAAERYRGSFYPGPHKFDLEMQEEAFEWFDRWLKT